MNKNPIKLNKAKYFHALLEDLMHIASHLAWNAP